MFSSTFALALGGIILICLLLAVFYWLISESEGRANTIEDFEQDHATRDRMRDAPQVGDPHDARSFLRDRQASREQPGYLSGNRSRPRQPRSRPP